MSLTNKSTSKTVASRVPSINPPNEPLKTDLVELSVNSITYTMVSDGPLDVMVDSVELREIGQHDTGKTNGPKVTVDFDGPASPALAISALLAVAAQIKVQHMPETSQIVSREAAELVVYLHELTRRGKSYIALLPYGSALQDRAVDRLNECVELVWSDNVHQMMSGAHKLETLCRDLRSAALDSRPAKSRLPKKTARPH